ncbi:MAG: type II 3-dehydroquinate dehydratase [bacterium]
MKKTIRNIKIMVIHGPNLNLLGKREPELYGTLTLREINKQITDFARSKSVKVKTFQSNHEGKIIDCIQRAEKKYTGIVINPGALTHYSYTIRDAVAAVSIPVVEAHLSDIHHREDFRRISVISPVCVDQISGLGVESYMRGIERILKKIK